MKIFALFVFQFHAKKKNPEKKRKKREEHGREAADLRNQSVTKEASLKREIDQAKSAAAALSDANLSLEGELAGLADREAALKNDLREQKEASSRVLNEVRRRRCRWGVRGLGRGTGCCLTWRYDRDKKEGMTERKKNT